MLINFSAAVNWSEGLLALNRLTAILCPLHFRFLNRDYVQYIALLACWTGILLFVIPELYDVWGVYRMSYIGTCSMRPNTLSGLVLLIWSGYVPAGLIGLSAIVIVGKFIHDSRVFGVYRQRWPWRHNQYREK